METIAPPPPAAVTLSQEEHDILTRSKRKSKRIRLPDSYGEDSGMDLEILDGAASEPGKLREAPKPVSETKQSYRDKLTNVKQGGDEWRDWSDTEEDEDLIPKFNDKSEPFMGPLHGPNVTFTPEEKELMWRPWRKAVIVKPLHRSIGYTALCSRAKSLWRLEGDFRAIDIGHGCFVCRFSRRDDYKRVLTEGPWSIGGYCLIVRQWNPYFRPENDVVEATR